jgi:diacylglycerol kinase family enzyme
MNELKRVLIVYNPVSGGAGDPSLWLGQVVNRLCKEMPAIVNVIPTSLDMNHQDLLPHFANCDMVVAAGGDGTVRLVLSAMANCPSKAKVGIVPMGTANILARNLELYEENILSDPLDDAISVILNGSEKQIDLGIMNGHYFSVAAGAGPLADATIQAGRFDKANWKLLAYATSMMHKFALPPVVFGITADNDQFQLAASGIFVSNVANVGMGMLSDTAELDDGWLDMCILNPQHFRDYFRLGFHFTVGAFGGEAPYYIRKVKKVHLEVLPIRSPISSFQFLSQRVRNYVSGKSGNLPPRMKEATAMIDGDACGTLPMDIEVVPQAVTILVPPPPEENPAMQPD